MKNQQQHREEIEQFCRNYIKGNNKYLNDIIDNYRHLIIQIDIQQLNLTQETYDSSLKSISRKLFNSRPADERYTIPFT